MGKRFAAGGVQRAVGRERPATGLLAAWVLAAGSVALAGQAAGADEGATAGLRVPEGFGVSLVAGDELAHDIYAMTLDAAGRVVVAGRGYVKTLHDDDGDGRADRATRFASAPVTGARGLYFEGPHLICSGDNALARYEDHDGDLAADGPPVILARVKHAGEHAANGVVKGPDGWYYLACGNDAGIDASHATTPGSPVTAPHQGAMLRVAPDSAQSEVVAHGFRNPYDLAFDGRGSLLVVDADGERDQYLPWYSPTRLFDVAQGMHHGWMHAGWNRSWNRPESFFDNVERLLEIGRGSPTGAVVYRHRRFPPAYQGGVFSACWSLGCVYYFPLTAAGATYASRRDVFLEATGGAGFAPVDLAVGPEGDLFVAIGGRGTRGGVFRITWEGKSESETENAERDAEETEELAQVREVLRAPQPLASWSRARWIPLARELGEEAFAHAACDESLAGEERIRAIEVLVEAFQGVPAPLARKIVEAAEGDVLARVAWALARKPQGPEGETLLAELTHRDDPWVERAAWEALAALPQRGARSLLADWDDLATRRPRRVRAAAILATSRLHDEDLNQLARWCVSPEATLALLWARHFRDELEAEHFATVRSLFEQHDDGATRLEATRLLQLLLGDIRLEPTRPDVYGGYAPNETERQIPRQQQDHAMRALAGAFPSGDEALDRELARLAAMLQLEAPPPAETSSFIETLAAKWTPESRVEDDLHYLMVLSRLPGERSEAVTRRTAAALANLHPKMRRGQMYASRYWPERVGETFAELSRRDERLAETVLEHPAFALPDQSIFALRMPDAHRIRAARRLMERAEDAWSAELVRLAAVLPPEEHQPPLRAVWEDDYALRETVTGILAEQPRAEDRRRFVAMLRTASPEGVATAAKALTHLGAAADAEEIAAALGALRQYVREKQHRDTAESLHRLLAAWSNGASVDESLLGRNPSALHERWVAWFAESFPEHAAALQDSPEADAAAILTRVEALPEDQGDADRGRAAFEKFSCARCHLGNSRFGPDLNGVGNRFSRRDLFLAIVDPNRDVSAAYRPMQVATGSGRVVVGQIVYESPEATLVQTDPETTVRIAGDEILSLEASPLSPMPTGLLRSATDEELADLYAFLRKLGSEQGAESKGPRAASEE